MANAEQNSVAVDAQQKIRPSGSNSLELREVSKAFGGLIAVHQVSFVIHPGEIVALIGPNGSGKTTIFNLISGFLSPTHGEIWFEERNLKGLPAHRITSLGIGRTFQNLQVFTNMSVVENVMAGRHLRSKAGLLRTAFRLPPTQAEEKGIFEAALGKLVMVGLETESFTPPLSLPYGKQKLLEIARALATEPKLLLMDEPAGGLSTQEIEDLARLICLIQDRGITVLLVEHRMELAMGIADRVVVLNFGEKIAEGTPDEVQANEQVITAYLGEEF
jgi:branched-chain amino acid transport system ATP-binding protein